MGLELIYQAIPADCELLKIARTDTDLGEQLGLIPYLLRRITQGDEERIEERLLKECRYMLIRWPDLWKRNCYLDRDWDVLHYLLSSTRRGEPPTADACAIDKAFKAGDLIAPHVVGIQGVPVRYLPADAVRMVARAVEPMTRADLARHYDPARLVAAGVYKFHPDEQLAVAKAGSPSRLDQAAVVFDGFRQFFLEAAARGDQVICCLD
jgi:hypothetical protein